MPQLLPPPRKVYRTEGHDWAEWRIPTQDPPKNAFIPDARGDAWRPGDGWGRSEDAADADDEYNGEDKTPNGLGHLDTRQGRWVPDDDMVPPQPRGGRPFQDGETSYGRSFDAVAGEDDELPAWTRRRVRGSNPEPNSQGAYYHMRGGPVPGNRRATHAGVWLEAPLQQLQARPTQQLQALPIQRTASRLAEGDSKGVGTEWRSTAAAAADAASLAAQSAAAAVPVLTRAGAGDTGLFGGVTGSASSSDVQSSLWGTGYDAAQS